MKIHTTRFGTMAIDDDRITVFPEGLLGFPDRTSFALLQTDEENYFFWLQSIQQPDLAFVVTDPTIFFKDYDVPNRSDHTQILTICNFVDGWITANLLGPALVDVRTRVGTQIVLTGNRWSSREQLVLAKSVQLNFTN